MECESQGSPKSAKIFAAIIAKYVMEVNKY